MSYAVPFWTTLHLLSNVAPYWATRYSTELSCTLLSYSVPTKLRCTLLSKVHPAELHSTLTELSCTLLGYAESYWSTLNPTELRGTLLSYAVSFWAMQHYVSYTTAKLSCLQYSYLCVQFCQMSECRTVRYRNKSTLVRYRNTTVPDWGARCRNTDAGGIGIPTSSRVTRFVPSWTSLNWRSDPFLHQKGRRSKSAKSCQRRALLLKLAQYCVLNTLRKSLSVRRSFRSVQWSRY